jgi:hypothetical protein
MRSTFTHPYRFGKLNERFGEISDCRLLILIWHGARPCFQSAINNQQFEDFSA